MVTELAKDLTLNADNAMQLNNTEQNDIITKNITVCLQDMEDVPAEEEHIKLKFKEVEKGVFRMGSKKK
jgi:hypothetical protein